MARWPTAHVVDCEATTASAHIDDNEYNNGYNELVHLAHVRKGTSECRAEYICTTSNRQCAVNIFRRDGRVQSCMGGQAFEDPLEECQEL